MKQIRTILVVVLLAVGSLASGQNGDNPAFDSVTFPVFSLNPAPVPGASIALVGQPGQTTWYFWASANYQLGSVVSYLGSVSNAPNTLSGSNYISIIPTGYPGGVLTVDILATTGPLAPVGACNCAIATGLTSGGANFQSNTLSSYSVSILNPQAFNLRLTNEVTGTGAVSLVLRNAYTGALICNLSTGCGGGTPAGATGTQLVGVGGTSSTFQTKPIIDVRDAIYAGGMKCDGATNDTAAGNAAFAAAVAVGTSTGTAYVQIPAGICVGNFSIVQGKGLKIEGSGELSTHLRSPNANPAMQINGLWYSSFSDLTFDTNIHATNAVLELDGDYDGTHHQGVQFVTFTNVFVYGVGASDGLLSPYVTAVCRQGGGGGCQGSNVVFLNSAMNGASTYVYYQVGFNALGNQFIGGDIQNYKQDGLHILNGSIDVYGTTFETTYGCQQLLNGGYDIYTNGGNQQANLIQGVRTEGWTLARGTASAPLSIDAVTQNSAANSWAPNTNVALNYPVYAVGSDSKSHLYCVTTAGETGVGAPTWPASGTVTDNTVTWTEENYNFISMSGGWFNSADSYVAASATINTSGNMGSVVGSVGLGNFFGGNVSGNTFSEWAISTQTYKMSLYSNPSGSPQTSVFFPTISYPASEAGIYGFINIGPRLSIDGSLVTHSTFPTITGCGTISSKVGGGLSGTFVTSATSCTPVLTGLPSATSNGYNCLLWDQTNPTAPIGNLSSTTSSATFGNFTTTASDVIAFQCGLSY